MINPIDKREVSLLALAHTYGATVHLARLPGSVRGWYDAAMSRILLRDGMTTAQRVSTLAHEVVHARRGDVGPQDDRTEALIDEEAAGLVVLTADYAAAEQLVGPDPRALAVELDVTPTLVAAWQRRASRIPSVLI